MKRQKFPCHHCGMFLGKKKLEVHEQLCPILDEAEPVTISMSEPYYEQLKKASKRFSAYCFYANNPRNDIYGIEGLGVWLRESRNKPDKVKERQ